MLPQRGGRKQRRTALSSGRDISIPGEVDTYSFRGKKGDFFNAELISVIGRDLSFVGGIMGQLFLYQIGYDGSRTLIGSNKQSFESIFDAEIFDVVLPADGTYELDVAAPDEFFFAD